MILTSLRPPGLEPAPEYDSLHTSSQVVIRWISRQTPQQVQGFTAMEVLANKNKTTTKRYPYLINKTYGEFNSGAWLVNLGNPQCA